MSWCWCSKTRSNNIRKFPSIPYVFLSYSVFAYVWVKREFRLPLSASFVCFVRSLCALSLCVTGLTAILTAPREYISWCCTCGIAIDRWYCAIRYYGRQYVHTYAYKQTNKQTFATHTHYFHSPHSHTDSPTEWKRAQLHSHILWHSPQIAHIIFTL